MIFDRVICEYKRRAEDRAKQKQQHCNINNNQYNILHNDTLEAYGKYNHSWSLDSAASGHYCGKNTKINDRKATTAGGIQVRAANNQSMKQIEEGELPFDWLPTAANHVQVFPSMQYPLIWCGKLATNGCGIWLVYGLIMKMDL
jgi:hypothetical protein